MILWPSLLALLAEFWPFNHVLVEVSQLAPFNSPFCRCISHGLSPVIRAKADMLSGIANFSAIRQCIYDAAVFGDFGCDPTDQTLHQRYAGKTVSRLGGKLRIFEEGGLSG